MTSKGERAVDHQYFIRAPPDVVFRAISDPRMLTRWLCDEATLSPKKGGRYSLSWTGGPTHTGTVVEFRDGERVSLSWTWPGVTLRGTVFSLSVEAKDDGSLFRIGHAGFPRLEEWADLYGGAEWGWTYFALNLKSVLENGHDLRSRYDG
ncbi:MAG TPA: SRPBCC domain-containing protein [Thermoplasmata archaeon]|nr:SRPBCC domain-containing protein [Thermoplasmata archaeon]